MPTIGRMQADARLTDNANAGTGCIIFFVWVLAVLAGFLTGFWWGLLIALAITIVLGLLMLFW